MSAITGWVAGVLCLAVTVVVVLSALAYREAARTQDSMEGDRR